MKRAIVVVGAGASHDCANEASKFSEEWRPPLAWQLFNMSERPAFQPILQEFRGAGFLASELAASGNLEASLAQMKDHKDSRIRLHFLDVPPYLCTILRKASTEFAHVPGVYVQLVKGLVADGDHRVLFITFNYDDLLEQAIYRFDRTLTFHTMADYCDKRRHIQVIKLHGSATWFRECLGTTGGLPEFGNARVIGVFPTSGPQSGMNQRIFSVEASANMPGNKLYYPELTAPIANKSAGQLACPEDHAAAVLAFGSEPYKLLMIGFSGRDKVLADLVAPITDKCTRAELVDPDAEGVLSRVDTLAVNRLHLVESRFARYVRSPAFKRFLDA